MYTFTNITAEQAQRFLHDTATYNIRYQFLLYSEQYTSREETVKSPRSSQLYAAVEERSTRYQ